MFDLPANRRDPTPGPDLGVVAPHWAPVVARDLRAVGFRIALRTAARGRPDVPLAALLDSVLNGFRASEATGFPHGLVVLAPLDLPLDESLAHWRAPRNVLLEIGQQEAEHPERLRLLLEVQRHGVRLALRLAAEPAPPPERLPLFQYVVLPAERAARAPRGAAVLALDPCSRAAAAETFAAGAHAVVGWPLQEPAVDANGQLQPLQKSVLELIRLVQSDADGPALERAFKAEPVLSYMLLTLANSPAFARTSPIASIQQAVGLLGYQRLLKWLVLLLVVASKHSRALPYIYTAVARGFFMEHLAAARGAPAALRDEGFVVGAFSLLDKITGRSLAQLFADLTLPAPVAAALLDDEGPHAPHLRLARALQAVDGGSDAAAEAAADLPRAAVNRALLQALAAADALHSAV
ncbi:MAG: HDOD domain-containing protein [Burkholderiaceae bacterium]|nr:HDOD domain-containing protein [Burkholderiaceae bacterium]